MSYALLKKILFQLDTETAHSLALNSLALIEKLHLSSFFSQKISSTPCTIMGNTFPNPIGLAAGLDKNGDYIDALASLGFGFLEIGTITKKPQQGNPKPRLFRLTEQEALINRMGFNNKGVDYLVHRLKHSKYQGILGINIGKNRETPIVSAQDEYLYLFNKVAPFASYITINISSPNTENLRDLQHNDLLYKLLGSLKYTQAQQKKYVPLVVKIAPDLSKTELESMACIFLEQKIDGVIATNTTLHREEVADSVFASEAGGLSGKPLSHRSTQVIRELNFFLQGHIPIIGCGGIMNVADAQEKFTAGAALLQIYTGLIYAGPGLIKSLLQASS